MSPTEEAVTSAIIVERLRGLIVSGSLGRGERLPTVRQTAADFGVAVGTAARAFRHLESEGLVVTRTGGGTRVADGASPLPGPVVARARTLVDLAREHGASIDDLQSALSAIWAETD